ncbi:MAG: hypothetical protein AB7E36_10850 [Salinivirgaceae bacterium]
MMNLLNFSFYYSWRIKSFLLFAPFLLSYYAKSQEVEETFYGRWFNLYNNKNYIGFSNDTMEIGILHSFSFKQPWSLLNEGVIFSGKNTDNIEIMYKYYFIEDLLVIETCKENNYQIDEIAVYSKNINTKKPVLTNCKISVNIQCEKQGLYMILLPNFNNVLYDHEHRSIVLNKRFTESLIFMSSKDYILKNFEFTFKNKILPLFIDDELIVTKSKINKNEIIVCLYGLNQIDRTEVNSVLNNNIIGNILFLYFGAYDSFKMHPSLSDF